MGEKKGFAKMNSIQNKGFETIQGRYGNALSHGSNLLLVSGGFNPIGSMLNDLCKFSLD